MEVAVSSEVRDELTEVARAVAGGLLFGVPLLYTMELWWFGQRASGRHTLVVLVLTVLSAVVLQRTSGFRRTVDVRWRDAMIDAVTLVGVSLIVVTVVLFVLREVRIDDPMGVSVAKIVHQALAFTIGAGVARHFLRASRDGDGDGDGTGSRAGRSQINATFADVGATVLGAVFIALNVAPTDEIPMLHAQIGPIWTVVVLLCSLGATYLIVFVAGFAGEQQRRTQSGILQHPLTETAVCYLVSLVCALGMLALFDRLDGAWRQDLSMAVILALPASVGGAAGRLAV